MEIYVIRHGKDDDRYRGGWTNLPLTQEGVNETKDLADKLYENINEYNFQKVISSDLIRAKQTAQIINEKLNLDIEYTGKLREINNGHLAGLLDSEASAKYPGVYFSALKLDEKYPGGESPTQFYNRIKEYLYYLIDRYKELDNILLITHAGVINIIYCILNDVKWTNKAKAIKAEHSSIYKFDVDNKNI